MLKEEDRRVFGGDGFGDGDGVKEGAVRSDEAAGGCVDRVCMLSDVEKKEATSLVVGGKFSGTVDGVRTM